MLNRKRDDFIRVIRNNLKTGANRAVALAKSVFKLIRVLFDPMKLPRVNSIAEKVLDKHPVLGLLSGFAGAIAIVPITTALFGTVTSVSAVVLSTTFAWIGSMWIGTAALIVGPSILVPTFKVVRTLARFITDAITFVFSLIVSVLSLFTILFAAVFVVYGYIMVVAATVAHKLVWAISLLLQTPAMLLEHTASDTWRQYIKTWNPRQFAETPLSSTFTKLANVDDAIVMNFPVGKNRPTAKQTKRHKTLGPVNQMGTA